MTINYCDFITGDDTTGDGSSGNPYKTITKASTGLTGGDEVRVAKSPTPTNLTGTLGFTLKSTAVVGSGTLFTSELAIGDFVEGGDGYWYEFVTITSDTQATLYKRYSGNTQAGVSSRKLGVTDTGAAPGSTTAIQQIQSSGSSGNTLKVSGGWDLTTQTQTGHSWFRQMHGTFNNRYGYGLYFPIKNYVEVESCSFLRYRYGMYLLYGSNYTVINASCLSNASRGIYGYRPVDSTFNNVTCNCNDFGINLQERSATFNNVTCNSNTYGIYLSSNTDCISTTTVCDCNTYYGLYLMSSHSNTFTNPICNNNLQYGINITGSHNNTFTNPICNNNTQYGINVNGGNVCTFVLPTCNNNSHGIYINGTYNTTITKPTCNNNQYGIYFNGIYGCIINKYSGTGNTTADIYAAAVYYFECPLVQCQHFNAIGVNKCFYAAGITERDTADAQSDQCLKYAPTSAVYYIRQPFFFKADSGVAQTLSAYIKDDVSFNGDVQAAIFFMGEKITGWTAWTPTTSYVQQSIIAALGDITEDGVLELRIKVRGTAGNVFVDDLATG